MKIDRVEAITGPAGDAEEFRPVDHDPSDPPGWEATLVLWRFVCPGQSIGWDAYRLSVVHLRELPNVDPPTLSFPEATHEFVLMALDPAHAQEDDPATWRFLTPFNFVGQVALPSDEDAIDLAGKLAEAVVSGVLWAEPPLSAQVEPWKTALESTAAHYWGHPENDESPHSGE